MKYIIYSLLCVFLVGCMTYKPDSGFVSIPDHNKVVSVTNPHYKKRPTVIGYGAMGLASAGGAYLGYTANDGVFVRQDAEGRKPNRIANGALGALLGFASVSLTLNLSGMNKVTPSTNFQSWLHDADNSYVNCSNSLTSQNMALPRTMERDFNVKSINDVRIFYTAYGSSTKKEQVFNDGLEVIKRNEIPDLIALNPLSNNVSGAQKRYYELSESIAEILDAKSRYPDIVFDVEKKASELVKYLSDAEMFFKQYTNKSKYADAVFDKLVPTLDLSEIVNLIALHPNAKNRNKAIDQAVSMVKTMNDIERLIQFNNTHGDQLEEIGEDIILADIYTAENKFDAFLALFPKSNRIKRYNRANYIGGWDAKKKYPMGNGILKEIDDNYFEIGNFKSGKLSGENCRIVSKSITFSYEMAGQFSNGMLNGSGRIQFKDGNTYTGQFVDGKMSGKGKYCGSEPAKWFPYFLWESVNTACYDGQWLNDLAHGYGELTSTSRNTGIFDGTGSYYYKGNFLNGMFDGKGSLYFQKFYIDGDFKKGEPNGRMALSYGYGGVLGAVLNEKRNPTAYKWEDLGPDLQGTLDSDNAKRQRFDDEDKREKEQHELKRKKEEEKKCITEYRNKFLWVNEKTGPLQCNGAVYKMKEWTGGYSSNYFFQCKESKKWFYDNGKLTKDKGPFNTIEDAIAECLCK